MPSLIASGIGMGFAHVLSGPDHMSALATLSAGSGWRAFAYGVQWGGGHSIGLMLMTFLLIEFDVDLEKVAPYAEGVVGVVMLLLGLSALRRANATRGDSSRAAEEAKLQLRQRRKARARAGKGRDEEAGGGADSDEDEVSALLDNPAPGRHGHGSAARNYVANNTSPATQRMVALVVGIVHGVAGPGAILGVLPAIQLHDGAKATVYLGTFCITSILVMGAFAACYGELTVRLGGQGTQHVLLWISGGISVAVGLLWLLILASGRSVDSVF